ncbi:ABC transporter permease [Haloferacaceae archaeon DSL9]
MSTETERVGEAGRSGVRERTKYYVAAYPMTLLGILMGIPLGMLFVFSFYENIVGGYYQAGATLENYVRFFDGTFYLGRLWFTLQLSAVTTALSLFVGYPLAYYLSQLRNATLRSALMILIVSSLWLTYVIRAYAWQIILSRNGILNEIGLTLGVIDAPVSLEPGYWALVIGMVYVFLPFMILTVYSSLKNIDGSLLEASRDLGADPITTFRRVTLPLSKNGIVGGSALVFILSLGAYVMPRILGGPGERTLPVIIAEQVMMESNVPFGAAMSILLLVVVLALLWATVRFTSVSAAGLSGKEEL